jgi:hypothetical protein
MKKFFLTIFLIPLIISCNQIDKKAEYEKTIKKEALDVAIKYARGKFKVPEESIDRDGIITVKDSLVNYILSGAYQIKYIIDPAKIVYGLIDDDTKTDAIAYIADINGQDLETPEHLILIQTEGKFILNRVIETNMKVLGIKDGIITAEVSSRSLNSPLRDCHVCKEVVKYRFKSGDLIRVD